MRHWLRHGSVCLCGSMLSPMACPASASTQASPPISAAAANNGSVIGDGAPASAATGNVKVPLDVPLTLNGKFLGTISVAVDPDGDGEIDARRLLELFGPVITAKIRSVIEGRIAGRSIVPIAALAGDGLDIAFDTLSLSVIATLPTDATSATAVRIVEREGAPEPGSFDRPSGFALGANISATQRYIHNRGQGFQPLSVDVDGIMNIGGFDGVTFTGGIRYDGNNRGNRWERNEIRATRDYYESAVRATVGEFTPASTSFQGSGRILGFGVERAFSTIRPFQNVRPIGRQNFVLDRESSVEVYVNDIRVQTLRLAAGRYDIGDFPFAAGSNSVRLVVDDTGGRREILDFNIFSGADLLNPGVTDFGGAVGLREGEQRLHYGSPAATGYIYRGISNNLTLGLNAQATSFSIQAGGSALWGSPLGFVQIEASTSRSLDGHGFGTALSVDYRGEFSLLRDRDLRLNMSSVMRSANFQDAFTSEARNLQAWQSAAQVQWRAPYEISLGLGYGYTRMRGDSRNVHRFDANIGRTFGRFSLNGTASHSTDDRGSDWRLSVGVSVRLGPGWYGDARYDSGTQRKEIEISRASEGRLDELSGNLRFTDERDGTALAGRLAYINNRFDLVLNHNRLGSRSADGPSSAISDWNFRGFIGFAEGAIGLGRTVNDGFIVAPVHETLSGSQVSIRSGERTVARSGLFGPALVPVNRAYGSNRYEVRVEPLPIGYDIGSGVINIFPGFGSGYRAEIGSDASRIATGYLVTRQGPLSLVGGTVQSVDDAAQQPRPFFTNRNGRFVADRLAPGRYRLVVGGKVVGEFSILRETKGLIDVGTLAQP